MSVTKSTIENFEAYRGQAPVTKNTPSLIPVTRNSIVYTFYTINIYNYVIYGDGFRKLIETYLKWLYIEDVERIDLILAVALSQKSESRTLPLWLFLIGASGDMKSEQIRALYGWELSKPLSMITPKTFVNGYPKLADEVLSLNNHLLLTNDLAMMLNMNRDEKVEIWSQLRDLYDGFIAKSFGSGKKVAYKDLFFTWIAGSTPAIDDQILLNQTLGTRELVYRIPPCKDKEKLEQRIRENLFFKDIMREELANATKEFLNSKNYKRIKIEDNIFRTLSNFAEFLCYMRAEAKTDSYTGETLSDASPEQPTRILEQLIKLFWGLKSLDDNYEDEKALYIISKVVLSSASQYRIRIFEYLLKEKNQDKNFTPSKISSFLRIGKKTSFRELNILWNLQLLERNVEEIKNSYGTTIGEVYHFSLNENSSFVKKFYLKQFFQIGNNNFIQCQNCFVKSPPASLNEKGICEYCFENSREESHVN